LEYFQVQGNILRILEAKPEDRGLYVCRAENAAGVAQASVSVEVERMYQWFKVCLHCLITYMGHEPNKMVNFYIGINQNLKLIVF